MKLATRQRTYAWQDPTPTLVAGATQNGLTLLRAIGARTLPVPPIGSARSSRCAGPTSHSTSRDPSLPSAAPSRPSLARAPTGNPSPKSDAGLRTLVLPDFAVSMLHRRRRAASDPESEDPVFPTRNGTWQQVVNVERRWRGIRKDTELEWVTPHTFRKTVATLIAERVDSETASDQLGHSSPEITREHYIAKPVIAADVLEELGGPDEE